MPGEWQVTSERIIDPENTEKKPEALALGVRKRVVDEEEAELNEAKKRRWGSTYRTHPTEDRDDDLDALLSNATRKGKEPATKVEVKEENKQEISEPQPEDCSDAKGDTKPFDIAEPAEVKRELSDGDTKAIDSLPPIEDVKQEADEHGRGDQGGTRHQRTVIGAGFDIGDHLLQCHPAADDQAAFRIIRIGFDNPDAAAFGVFADRLRLVLG